MLRKAHGVAHLVVDQVLAVAAQITLERHGAAHPARLVEQHRIFAGDAGAAAGLGSDLHAAQLRGGVQRCQTDFQRRVVVDADVLEAEARVVDPTARVAQRRVNHARKRLVPAVAGGVDAVLDLHGEAHHDLVALAGSHAGSSHLVEGAGAGGGVRPARWQIVRVKLPFRDLRRLQRLHAAVRVVLALRGRGRSGIFRFSGGTGGPHCEVLRVLEHVDQHKHGDHGQHGDGVGAPAVLLRKRGELVVACIGVCGARRGLFGTAARAGRLGAFGFEVPAIKPVAEIIVGGVTGAVFAVAWAAVRPVAAPDGAAAGVPLVCAVPLCHKCVI